MTEIYVSNENGVAKMTLTAEQERAVYTVLGLKVDENLNGKVYSDRYVSLITNTIERMIPKA